MPLQSLSHTRVTLTILWEKVSICVRVPYSCFLEDLYKVDNTVTVVLTMHSNPFCRLNGASLTTQMLSVIDHTC